MKGLLSWDQTQVSSFTARHSLGKSRKSQTVRWARSHSEVIRYWRPLTSHPDTQGNHWNLDRPPMETHPRHDRTVRTTAQHGVIYKERKSLNGWRSGFSGGSHDFETFNKCFQKWTQLLLNILFINNNFHVFHKLGRKSCLHPTRDRAQGYKKQKHLLYSDTALNL